jgi:hypothetical protein
MSNFYSDLVQSVQGKSSFTQTCQYLMLHEVYIGKEALRRVIMDQVSYVVRIILKDETNKLIILGAPTTECVLMVDLGIPFCYVGLSFPISNCN